MMCLLLQFHRIVQHHLHNYSTRLLTGGELYRLSANTHTCITSPSTALPVHRCRLRNRHPTLLQQRLARSLRSYSLARRILRLTVHHCRHISLLLRYAARMTMVLNLHTICPSICSTFIYSFLPSRNFIWTHFFICVSSAATTRLFSLHPSSRPENPHSRSTSPIPPQSSSDVDGPHHWTDQHLAVF